MSDPNGQSDEVDRLLEELVPEDLGRTPEPSQWMIESVDDVTVAAAARPEAGIVGPGVVGPEAAVAGPAADLPRSRRRSGILFAGLAGLAIGLAAGAAFLFQALDSSDDTAGAEITSQEVGGESANAASDVAGTAGTDTKAPADSRASLNSNLELDPKTGQPFHQELASFSREEIEALEYPHVVLTVEGKLFFRGRTGSQETAEQAIASFESVVGQGNVTAEHTIEPGMPFYEDTPVFFDDFVFFDFNSTELNPMYHPALDMLLATLQVDLASQIKVVAYADAAGSEDVNLKISQQRADAVVEYWLSKGADQSLFAQAAMGEEFASEDDDPDAAAFQRRVEFTILPEE